MLRKWIIDKILKISKLDSKLNELEERLAKLEKKFR